MDRQRAVLPQDIQMDELPQQTGLAGRMDTCGSGDIDPIDP